MTFYIFHGTSVDFKIQKQAKNTSFIASSFGGGFGLWAADEDNIIFKSI